MLYIKLQISCQADISFERNSILLPSTRKSASRIACSACARNQFRRAIAHRTRRSALDKSTSWQSFSLKCMTAVKGVRSVHDITAKTTQEIKRSLLTTAGENRARLGTVWGLRRSPPVRSGYSESSLVERSTPLVRWHLIRLVVHNTLIRRHLITSDGGHLDLQRIVAFWRIANDADDERDDADRWRRANGERRTNDTSPQTELTLPTDRTDRPRARLG